MALTGNMHCAGRPGDGKNWDENWERTFGKKKGEEEGEEGELLPLKEKEIIDHYACTFVFEEEDWEKEGKKQTEKMKEIDEGLTRLKEEHRAGVYEQMIKGEGLKNGD